MEKTDNNISDRKLRLTIRVATGTMSFSVGDPQADGQIVFEEYGLNNGISTAANLREAFTKSELLQSGYKKALVLTGSPVMLLPADEEQEQDCATLYHHIYDGHHGEEILHAALPDLNAVAVFAVNKDLKLVVEDHFGDFAFVPLMQPVWTRLYHRSFSGTRRKLFAYFHEKRMEVFLFQQNRFQFSNSFDATYAHDAAYYLLYAWRQLGMDKERDEVYLAGNITHLDWLRKQLPRYVRRSFIINQNTDFNNISMAQRDDIPYDLKASYFEI
ncbi:DUF3822 family protein [Prevotella dentasini]|uniref:DUF3822 family protein n=1 Tax=Prevotella dentasini TaxID=589537 RepID=UPI00046AED09|nr:DUF3822 family protein [Prevotella dentasini]